jgi:serine O-acetyltransferase
MDVLQAGKLFASLVRLPLMLAYRLLRDRSLLDADIRRWEEVQSGTRGLLTLLAQPEFRSLYYLRLRTDGLPGRVAAKVLGVVYRPQTTLYITTSDIGPGFYIQHGFATIIAAKRIGANCWVNQQVTIGFDAKLGQPVLEDGVTVNAGAQIIGGVVVGANSTVGANAVVIRDVPAGTTAVGVPAHRS